MGCCLLLPIVIRNQGGRERKRKKVVLEENKSGFQSGKWFWRKVVFGEVLSRGDRVNER